MKRMSYDSLIELSRKHQLPIAAVDENTAPADKKQSQIQILLHHSRRNSTSLSVENLIKRATSSNTSPLPTDPGQSLISQLKLRPSRSKIPPPTSIKPPNPRRLYSQAVSADKQNRPGQALNLLLILKPLTPLDGRVYSRLSRLYKSTGQVELARAVLKEGLEVCRGIDRGYLLHGLSSFEIGADRIELLKEAIDLGVVNARHALGMEYMKNNELLKAFNILDFESKNHRIYHLKGEVLRKMRKYVEAEEAFFSGLKVSSNYGKSFFYTSLGVLRYELNDLSTARQFFEKSIEHNSRHAQGWLALGYLEEEGKVWERALRVFEGDIRRDGKWVMVYASYARFLKERGELSQAVKILSKAAIIFENDIKLIIDLGKVLKAKKDELKAREVYREGMERFKDVELWRAAGELEMDLMQYESARRIFQAAVRFKGGSRREVGILLAVWGVCEWSLKEEKRAGELFEQAEGRLEGNEESWVTLLHAKMEWSRENRHMASYLTKRAINLDPEAEGAYRFWAKVLEEDALVKEETVDDVKKRADALMIERDMNEAVGEVGIGTSWLMRKRGKRNEQGLDERWALVVD
ncbi:hypothetical protein TL16_g09623 [Triparma laevis f. inornata]|uniref:Uncharacterized protein n=1 Tax=Triparma laevis f. inornata TaxID=1714386 RepID=A0A9W7EJS9_9STRA|nr:hypothetical protein TL16_g09623 [Triparma laevis f. inornata]